MRTAATQITFKWKWLSLPGLNTNGKMKRLAKDEKDLLDKFASLRVDPDSHAESIRISIDKEVIRKKAAS